MRNVDRRDFLRMLNGATLAAALPQSIERSLAVPAMTAQAIRRSAPI